MPKAIAFEVLQGRGTARKDRHGTEKDQPKPSPGGAKRAVLSKDLHAVLDEIGRREWRRIMRITGTLVPKEIDRTVLLQYCLLYQRMVRDPDGFKAADHTQLRLCCVELGFSPSARVKLRGD